MTSRWTSNQDLQDKSAGNKKQRQDIEDKGEEEGNKRKGAGEFVTEEMVVYKSKGEPHVRMRCFILIEHIN